MQSNETKDERVTLRWPEEIKETLLTRAGVNHRSLSSEVRELLTYARNTILDDTIVDVQSWKNCRNTSISLTPRLKSWLHSRAQLNDRPVQAEILLLVSFALDHIMERDIAILIAADPAGHAPG
jgi:hypothetical protein